MTFPLSQLQFNYSKHSPRLHCSVVFLKVAYGTKHFFRPYSEALWTKLTENLRGSREFILDFPSFPVHSSVLQCRCKISENSTLNMRGEIFRLHTQARDETIKKQLFTNKRSRNPFHTVSPKNDLKVEMNLSSSSCSPFLESLMFVYLLHLLFAVILILKRKA